MKHTVLLAACVAVCLSLSSCASTGGAGNIFAASASAAETVPLPTAGEKYYKEITATGEPFSRWLECSSVTEYDRNGNETAYTTAEYRRTSEYDRHGNIVHHKDPSPGVQAEDWYEYAYDSKGNVTYKKQTHKYGVYEYWYEYDRSGNLVHSKDTIYKGDEDFFEYDARGNVTHKKSLGWIPSEEWREYDAGGNLVHTKRSVGGSTDEVWYTYNVQGKKSYERHSGGQQFWYEYDAAGNLVHLKTTGGTNGYGEETWYEYRADGTLLHSTEKSIAHTGSTERWYDAHGNEVYQKSVTGVGRVIESYTEYTYWPDGTIRTRALYYPV